MRFCIFAFRLSDVAPLVVPCTGRCSVVPCLRIFVAHADNIAHTKVVVAECIIHGRICKIGVLLCSSCIVCKQFICCNICQECSSGCMTQRTPREQPCQTIRCVCNLLATVTRCPVFQMFPELFFPLAVASIHCIQQDTALHGVVPAVTPSVFQFRGLFFLAQIRDVIGLAQIQIGLFTGCPIQPVCSKEQVIIECARFIIIVFFCIIADGAILVSPFKASLCVCQIVVCTVWVGILEAEITNSKSRCHLSFNTAVIAGVIRPCIFALHQFELPHVNFRRTPPYMVECTIANHVNDFIAQITACNVIQCPGKVVLIFSQFADFLDTILIFQQAPAQHGCSIGVGQCEFQVVAGIEPAARNIVVDHAVISPADFVPVWQFAALLYLIEKHRLL